jgi:tetratricopeptide (TPR) repeat protein
MRPLPTLFALPLLLLASCGQEASPAKGDSLEELVAAKDVEGIVSQLEPRREAGTLSLEDSLLLAEAFVAQDQIPRAEKLLKQCISDEPTALPHSLLLASIYSGLRMPQKAMDVLVAVQEAGAEGSELTLEMALTHGRLGDLKKAEELLLAAQAQGGERWDVEYNLALIYMEHERLEEARALLAGLHELDPSRISVRRELARAIFQLDDKALEEVRDHCNAVLEVNDKDWRAWELLADVELRAQDWVAAKAYYTHALKYGSEEVGANPPRVEEKYKVAALAVQEEYADTALIPESAPQKAPPLPVGAQERIREARRKGLEAEQNAAEGSEGGGQDGF